MKNEKTHGPDGIPPEAIKAVVNAHGEWMLRVINELIERQIYPQIWKVAKALLMVKKKQKPGTPKIIPAIVPIRCAGAPCCLHMSFSSRPLIRIRGRLEKGIEKKAYPMKGNTGSGKDDL